MKEIPFNKPFIAEKELFHVSQAVISGKQRVTRRKMTILINYSK